jgi:predicted dehydrogenase
VSGAGGAGGVSGAGGGRDGREGRDRGDGPGGAARYRAGVIGETGRGGYGHGLDLAFAGLPGVTIVAVADPDAAGRAAAVARTGAARGYADYREMLARERPDVVSVCTSARPRAAITADVVAGGGAATGVKAVWAEKPMAISLAEADAMVDACRAAGVPLAIGASRCWDATYNRMRELIDAGHIGRVLNVTGFGRCALSHNGSHLLTLVAYLAGGPTARCRWVFGQMESDDRAAGDDDLSGNGMLQFEDGVQAFVRTTDCGASDWDFEVTGTEGRLRGVNDAEEVEFWRLAPALLPGRRREPARHLFPRPYGAASANARTLHDLLRAIESGGEPLCNGEAGRQALEIAIALRESHRRGGARVDLPLADRSLRLESSETLRGDEPAAVRRARAAGDTP